MFRRLVTLVLVALVIRPSAVAAQQSRFYVGGTPTVIHQTHSRAEPLGGTTWGGSVVFGVQVSERIALEFEPAFGGAFTWDYTYRPGPSRTADVVASRRDTVFPFQLRSRLGFIEPVVGVGYVIGRMSRHATSGGRPYFDDARSDHGVALVGGLNAAVRLVPRLILVPTFRVFVVARPDSSVSPFFDPLGEQTQTGALALRYGVGARVLF